MSQFNGLMDGPPPAEVVERFVPTAAEAVRHFAENPSDENGLAVLTALAKGEAKPDALAVIDVVLEERRARIAQLLGALADELRGLGDDLGYRTWRMVPVAAFKAPVLATTTRSPKGTMSASVMLANLRAIAESNGGSVNLDAPRRVLVQTDFGRRGGIQIRGSDYTTREPGSESPDPRVMNNAR